jgi:hypothetical protein
MFLRSPLWRLVYNWDISKQRLTLFGDVVCGYRINSKTFLYDLIISDFIIYCATLTLLTCFTSLTGMHRLPMGLWFHMFRHLKSLLLYFVILDDIILKICIVPPWQARRRPIVRNIIYLPHLIHLKSWNIYRL